MLERDSFTARFFATPKVNRQTKEGKALAEGYRIEAAGRTMFPADWLPGIERIVDNARMHDKAREILGTGEAEVALAWIDPETGIKCKIKLDWWHRTRLLADVKSALDVTRDGFSKACARMHYALSAAMYCEGVLQLTGEEPEWAFIACEKESTEHGRGVSGQRCLPAARSSGLPARHATPGRVPQPEPLPHVAGRRRLGEHRPPTLGLSTCRRNRVPPVDRWPNRHHLR
jgi:hypothetical protein